MRARKLHVVSENDSNELRSLLDVGKALSSEHETEKILDMILEEATGNTLADGGSIYLIEKVPQDSLGGTRPKFKYMLRFHKTENKTVSYVPKRNQLLDIDNSSVAGYVALTGKSVRVRDCYVLGKDSPFEFNDAFDRQTGYRTKSVLAVPIKTNKDKVVGVVQLVNKVKPYRRRGDPELTPKNVNRVPEKDIIAFSEHDARLMEAFASHAAVALENAKLTEDIEKLFDSFIKASVSAIESRDPSTSGHSDRVAALTISLAQKVDSVQTGILKDVRFSPQQIRELQYAALLHDFGKIGVREHILLKSKKLFPHELETVLLRIDTIKSINEARQWRQMAEEISEQFKNAKTQDPQNELAKGLWNIDQFNRKLDQIKDAILKANESQVMDFDLDIKKLMESIEQMSRQVSQVILTTPEKERLLIARGTLSKDERKEIESHVTHTFNFLSQIAWTDDLGGIPEIAHCHHEKLNGAGYPRQLKSDQIPVQSRMMTICDIYDALTAMDRPYKKAVTPERAIEILHYEMNEGKLDPHLLKVFVEGEVFQVVHPHIRKKAA